MKTKHQQWLGFLLIPLGCMASTAMAAMNDQSCQPYFEEMFAAPASTQFRVHGARLYYEGGNPANRYFSALVGLEVARDVSLASEQNDHFLMTNRADLHPENPPILGSFWEARSDEARSIESGRGELSIKRDSNGLLNLYVAPMATLRNSRTPTRIVPTCYPINDNPKLFGIEGGYSNGSWVYDEWLFSIERVN